MNRQDVIETVTDPDVAVAKAGAYTAQMRGAGVPCMAAVRPVYEICVIPQARLTGSFLVLEV